MELATNEGNPFRMEKGRILGLLQQKDKTELDNRLEERTHRKTHKITFKSMLRNERSAF